MNKGKSAATESLRTFCSALIEELAALGGEETLFRHMQAAVVTAAAEGDLPALEETWKDLKTWTRSLTETQRANVARQMREKFGLTLSCDKPGGNRDLLIPDPPGSLENESR